MGRCSLVKTLQRVHADIRNCSQANLAAPSLGNNVRDDCVGQSAGVAGG